MKKVLLAIVLLSTAFYAQASKGAWGLYDYNIEQYQIAHNPSDVRSIASITKLFTAATILREGLDLAEKVRVQGKSSGRFGRGMMVTRLDLMKAMLISSDNLAAETLAHTYPGGFHKFIEDTNRWVQGLGLVDTTIVDASGLLPGNQSTVNNLVTFIYRLKQYPEILRISAEANAVLNIPKGRKHIKIHLKNTNPEVFTFDNIILSKTGTTNAAGRCVVMLVEKNSTVHAVVILGQQNKQERSLIAQTLLRVLPITQAYANTELSVELELP